MSGQKSSSEGFWSEGQRTLKPMVLDDLSLCSLEPHMVTQRPALNRNIIIANDFYVSSAYHQSHSVILYILGLLLTTTLQDRYYRPKCIG